MKKIISAIIGAFLLLAPTHASAVVHIKDNPGGVIDEFIVKWQAIRASGDTVVIDGRCASACTLVLAYVEPKNICATPNAVFGFHSAFWFNSMTMEKKHAAEATLEMVHSYPRHVRDALRAKGWTGQEHPELINLSGAELGVQVCAYTTDAVPYVVVSSPPDISARNVFLAVLLMLVGVLIGYWFGAGDRALKKAQRL